MRKRKATRFISFSLSFTNSSTESETSLSSSSITWTKDYWTCLCPSSTSTNHWKCHWSSSRKSENNSSRKIFGKCKTHHSFQVLIIPIPQHWHFSSSRLVHLKAHHEEDPPPSTTTYVPSQPRQTTIPATNPQPSAATTLVYPPQPNLRTVGYFQSDIPPHIMLQSQQNLHIPTQTSIHQPSTINQIPVTYPFSTQQPQTIPPAALYGYRQY